MSHVQFRDIDRLFTFIMETNRTPYSHLRALSRLVSSIALNSTQVPVVEWLDNDYLVAMVNCKRISTAETKAMMNHLSLDLNTKLLSLYQGFEGNSSVKLSFFTRDDYNDETPGYSCFNDASNNFVVHQQDLLQYLIHHKSNHFILGVSGGKIQWNMNSVRKWLTASDEFLMRLLVLIHLSSGLPMRGNEYASLLMKNGAVKSLRSIYFLKGTLAIIQRYTKTQSSTQKDSFIPRFLPHGVATLLLYFICYLVPVRRYCIVYYYFSYKL